MQTYAQLHQVKRKSRYVLASLLAFAFFHGYVLGAIDPPQQTQELRGEVVNEKNYPIAGVVCTLKGGMLPSEGISVTTGGYGRFTISGLLPGRYDLTCGALGYQPYAKMGLPVSSTLAPILHIVMPTLKKVVQRVEVRASANKVAEQSSAPPSEISSEALTTLPIAEQKFRAALPLVPGVIRSPTGKISIRGSVENKGMVLVDGAESADPITGSFDIDLSIDAIQSLNVYKAPFNPRYAGFSGGLTTIETKAPGYKWDWSLNDFFPGFRGRDGHLVGVNDWSPRLNLTGPLWKHNLNFSESFIYNIEKIPVRGLAWPHNETKKESWNSFTTLQYVVSPHHIVSVHFQLFPAKQEFANISALIQQPASSNYAERGYSLQGNDNYEFSSGGILSTVVKFTQFDAYAHGQGPEDMLINPNGYGGNWFNAWNRTSNQEEGNIIYRFPTWKLAGRHQTEIGGDLINAAYNGTSQSHPILVTQTDGTLLEQLDFVGPGGIPTTQVPAFLTARNAQGAAFIGDRWMVRENASVDLGLQYYGQAVGQLVTFAPRLGLVYSPGESGRTIFRAGAGIFKARVPLLASDFGDNPTQVVTQFDSLGNVLGNPLAYVNQCATRTSAGLEVVPDCSDLDATPYNLTWRLEMDQQMTNHIALRLSYLGSNTYREFTINPEVPSPTAATMLLSNRGASRYHEYEVMVSYRDEKGNELNSSYVRSRTLGDLNAVSDVFVPFQEPIIRPDAYTNLNADVPNRFISWGVFHLPFKIVFAPIIDWHTGFPWSAVNAQQNYVGKPNGLRFPGFFSFDFKVWKWLPLPHWLPFGFGNNKLEWGIGFHNATNALDPLAVYNNIASPYYGHFVGFQHRVIDINVNAH